MPLLRFLSENLSLMVWLGSVNGPADLDVSLDRASAGLGAALCRVGGHSRAGKGISIDGFAELKQRLKLGESEGLEILP